MNGILEAFCLVAALAVLQVGECGAGESRTAASRPANCLFIFSHTAAASCAQQRESAGGGVPTVQQQFSGPSDGSNGCSPSTTSVESQQEALGSTLGHWGESTVRVSLSHASCVAHPGPWTAVQARAGPCRRCRWVDSSYLQAHA